MSRKLDAAIAEALGKKVVWRKKKESYLGGSGYVDAQPNEEGARQFISHGIVLGDIQPYSTDGNAMLELDKEMRAREFVLELKFINYPESVIALYWQLPKSRQYENFSEANTEPLARALAAYRALTGEEWSE